MSVTLHRPITLDEAIALQQKTGGQYLAGGTVAMVDYNKGTSDVTDFISLEAIPALRGITSDEHEICIGALTSFTTLASHPLICQKLPALSEAAREIGAPQIRNRASVGGNLCAASPATDSAPPLLVYNTMLSLIGPSGTRRIPLSSFFVAPNQSALQSGEILINLYIELKSIPSVFKKIGRRNALSISTLSIALRATFENDTFQSVSIALGAVAPTPCLCNKTATLLCSAPFSPDLLTRAKGLLLTEISPIDDLRATAAYRKLVCQNELEKSLLVLKERCQNGN